MLGRRVFIWQDEHDSWEAKGPFSFACEQNDEVNFPLDQDPPKIYLLMVCIFVNC